MHKTSTEKAPEKKLVHPIQHVSNEFQKFRARNVFVKSIKIKMNTCHRSLSRPSVEPAHLQQQDLYRSPIVKKENHSRQLYTTTNIQCLVEVKMILEIP